MDDGYEYEASAPQWADFSKSTPRHVEGDEFFDRSHENLEIILPEKRGKLHLRMKSNNENPNGSLFFDKSKMENLTESEIQSTFINDIDEIRITPIKVTSPKTKNKEPIVMNELSINEVLTNAMKGLEIASAKSMNYRKAQLLNSTVCPSSTNNGKLTPAQRKIRISKSMHFQSNNTSNGKTPAAKAAAIPRNFNKSNINPSIDKDESEKDPIESTNAEENHQNASSTCKNYSLKFKTPTKLPRSTHPNPSSTNRSTSKNTNAARRSIKIPKVIVTMDTPTKNVNVHEQTVEEIIQIDTTKNTDSDKAPMENDDETHAIPNTSNHDEETEADINSDACPPDGADMNGDDKDCENHDNFESDLNNGDPLHTVFEVHRSKNVENRNYNTGRATLLTNPARRHSITNRRRDNDKYVSVAEAVSKFHRSTPTRFHTVSSKHGPVQRVKQQAITKSTIPVSPALKSKSRTRRYAVMSQAEREDIELQNARKHKIHANPIRQKILEAPETLKAVPKKPITMPKPFKLTSKSKITKSTTSKPSSAVPSTSSTSLHHSKVILPKRVMALAPSGNSQSLENQEIRDFGIPIVERMQSTRQGARKKLTKPQPFAFEERQKQLMNKKEQKLKTLQSEIEKKMKFEFHARPVPTAVKKNPVVEREKEKLQKPTISKVQPTPFSFEDRDKMLAKKKEELRKKIEEEEKKARIFHAKPVPVFKPVVVRSVSRENLKAEIKTKSAENLKTNSKTNELGKPNNFTNMTRGVSADNLKTVRRVNSSENIKNNLKKRSSSIGQTNNQENIAPNIPASKSNNPSTMPALKPKLKPLPIELRSDERARKRREFDEKIRIKLEQDEERRKQEQENRLAREQAEIAEIRRKAEIRARPMPVYKPVAVIKSNKPLTEAESPAWTRTKR